MNYFSLYPLDWDSGLINSDFGSVHVVIQKVVMYVTATLTSYFLSLALWLLIDGMLSQQKENNYIQRVDKHSYKSTLTNFYIPFIIR